MQYQKVMWPRGEAQVCKTLYGGSIPSMTSTKSFFIWQAIEDGTVFLYGPFLCVVCCHRRHRRYTDFFCANLCLLWQKNIYCIRMLLNKCFACPETSALKNRYLLIVLIRDGNKVKPCTAAVMRFFCFGSKCITYLYGFCKIDGSIQRY